MTSLRIIRPVITGRQISLLILLSFAFSNAFTQPPPRSSSAATADFTSPPKIWWEFKAGSPLFSSPVVGDILVYVGGLDSTLYAVGVSSGKEKWRFRTKGEIRSNVCLSAARLYLNGGDGLLYALDKQTGAVTWKFTTDGEKKYDFADYFQSTPVLFNGTLYFGSGDGNVYAVDAQTGTLVWRYKTGGIVHTTPAIDNGKLFVGSFDGFVYALNIADGTLAWKFKTVGHRYFPAGEVQGSPAVFKNIVFVGARDYNVYAIDEQKGFCRWNKAFTRGWGLSMNIHDSVLYIGSSDERVLIAADPESGEELWNRKMEFLVFGNNAYSDSMLYCGTTNGKLHGFKLRTGEKIWSFETETYRDNRLKYFKPDGSYRDDIYTIIKSNEQFLEVECELGGIFSTPAVTAETIIYSSTNGTLYALRR